MLVANSCTQLHNRDETLSEVASHCTLGIVIDAPSALVTINECEEIENESKESHCSMECGRNNRNKINYMYMYMGLDMSFN